MAKILKFLMLPGAPMGRDIDSPEAVQFHRQAILSKPFLRKLYIDFYHQFKFYLSQEHVPQNIIELGSGAGFVKEIIPQVRTSDLFPAPWIDLTFPVERIPIADGVVDAFIMLDVFHHLPDIHYSLQEMERCLRPGGRIIMIEPANTAWARFVYQRFHHEQFDVNADWKVSGKGRLSAANGALPWIVFVRDEKIFQKSFPRLRIQSIQAHTPFRYLLSGGVTYRSLAPSFLYPVIQGIEFLLSPLNRYLGLFQTIVIEKI